MVRAAAPLRAVVSGPSVAAPVERLEDLLEKVARGDHAAFTEIFNRVSGPVHGLVRRVLRDPAQSEEVTQEVLINVWRSAARFDPAKGSAMAWIMTMAHRRAVDRVRSEQSAADRARRVGSRQTNTAFDEVAETVEIRLEREAVRRCLGSLTDLQRNSIELAFYSGNSYREVAELLDVPLGTVKTRMRDGLIRLRDCLGVTA
ncbi:MAG TPA: sigma-70 family RNA polymerase sigma factor [Sporichthyaceae bacterium]|jgi:RNA polymerase sigma-70 factor (ECF subfamily)